MNRYQRIFIGLFLLIALGIRISAALHDNTVVIDRGDAHGYDQIAMSLALGKGYRFDSGRGAQTAWCTPLYPLFLSSIYRGVGHSYRAVRIVQAILSTMIVLLIALWAYILFGGASACFAALIASVYPAFYAYYFSSTSIGTETLYVLLFTAALYTFYYYWIRPSWPLAVISGLFWGLSNLTRPMSLNFLFFLPFISITLRYPLRLLLRYSAIAWFVVGLVLAPWMIRNYFIFHTVSPLSMGGATSFYSAYHPNNLDGLGGTVFHESFMLEDARLASLGINEAQRANYFLREGFEFIRAYPGNALRLFVKRIFLYLDPRTTLYHEDKRQIVTWSYIFVLAGTVIGFFLGLRRRDYRREVLSLCLIFGYFVLFHGFAGASERYRFPTEPILIIVTSFTLSFLLRFRRQNSNQA